MNTLLVAVLCSFVLTISAQELVAGACCMDDGSCELAIADACTPGAIFVHESVECGDRVYCLSDDDCAACGTCSWKRLCQPAECAPGACCVSFDDSRGTECFETEGSDSCTIRSFCADGSCTASYLGDGAVCQEDSCPAGCFYCARSREVWANNYQRLPDDLDLGECTEDPGRVLTSEHTNNAWTRLAQQYYSALLNYEQQKLSVDCVDNHEAYFGAARTCFAEAGTILEHDCGDIPPELDIYARAVECAEELRQFNAGTGQARPCGSEVVADELFEIHTVATAETTMGNDTSDGLVALAVIGLIIIGSAVIGCLVYGSIYYRRT